MDCVFDAIEAALARDERVEVRGLGSFQVRRYGAYRGRTSQNGAAAAVKPKRVPFFHAGAEMRELLNPTVTRTQEMPAVVDGQGRVTVVQEQAEVNSLS